MERGRGGVELCDVRVCQKLLVGATEDALRVGRDVDRGDLLSGLFSARGGGVEAFLMGSLWVASMVYAAGSSIEITKLVSYEELSFLAWEMM